MDEKFMSIGLNSMSKKQQELTGTFENITERRRNGPIVDSLTPLFLICQY
jgi:hypothetical protein